MSNIELTLSSHVYQKQNNYGGIITKGGN